MQPDVQIKDLIAHKKPLRSLEFFPPKDEEGFTRLKGVAGQLRSIAPEFVSVTYGAGGSTRSRTLETSLTLREDYGYTVMPHLTCVASTKAELSEIIEEFYQNGFRNVMALRGDPPKGQTTFEPYKDGLRYGSDLVALCKALHSDLCVGCGGYPEKHPEAESLEKDLEHLKIKVDAGADFITTQLFFDNNVYDQFLERCQKKGITIPIVPGIMPVLSLKQIKRFTQMCGASLPGELEKRLEQVGEEDPVAVENVGIEWALSQIEDLQKQGAPGVHLYILNRERAALTLAEGLNRI